MGELAYHLMWARVDYSGSLSAQAWEALKHAPPEGAGLAQADAVQVVAALAALRDLVAAPFYQKAIEFDPRPSVPRFVEIHEAWGLEAAAALRQAVADRGNRLVQVVGEAPWAPHLAPDDPLPRWGQKLGLALETVQLRMAKQKTGPAIPFSAEPAWFLGIPPVAMVAVIVAGTALAVIGAIAAWRYFDPDFRTAALMVRQAADDYAQRLEVYKQGQPMPPPSQIELDAAPTIQKMAAERSGTGWAWGLGIAGGLTALAVGASALANRESA